MKKFCVLFLSQNFIYKIYIKTHKKYAEGNKIPDTVELDYSEFTVQAKTGLTIEEKLSFVETVVSNAYIDGITPSSLLVDVAFTITFMQMVCVDLPLPMRDSDGENVVDSQAAYDIAVGLDILYKYAYLPAAYLAEKLGFNAVWDAKTNITTITKK